MAKPNILLRDFAPEDAAGLVACIREEYGASTSSRIFIARNI